MDSNANGIVDSASRHSVAETVERIKGALSARGVRLFALIDHAGEAARAGLQMRPTQLLIFGSPEAGTPVMVAAPTSALDLPLKILVWEDARGKVWASYNSAEYLQQRHGVPPELLPTLAVVASLAAAAGA
jgi:uncharacterized protein (DUF302 family)